MVMDSGIGLQTLFTAAATWIAATYSKAAVDAVSAKAAGGANKKWAEFRWDSAARRYRNKVWRLHGRIRALGSQRPVALSRRSRMSTFMM